MKTNSMVNLIKPCAFPSAVIIWKEYLKVKGYLSLEEVLSLFFSLTIKGTCVKYSMSPLQFEDLACYVALRACLFS